MACHLFGVKPLSESMLGYFQLDPWEHGILNSLTDMIKLSVS